MLLHSRDSTVSSCSLSPPGRHRTRLWGTIWHQVYLAGESFVLQDTTYNHIRILASALVRDSSTRGVPKLHSLPGEVRVEGIRVTVSSWWHISGWPSCGHLTSLEKIHSWLAVREVDVKCSAQMSPIPYLLVAKDPSLWVWTREFRTIHRTSERKDLWRASHL